MRNASGVVIRLSTNTMPQSEYKLNGAADRSKVAIRDRLISPVRGLNNTVHATDNMTGGKIFGTMAATSKNLRNGALVRIAIQARIAAFRQAAIKCLGHGVFTMIGEAGVYLLFSAEGIPIYPGGNSNVYVGRTMREFEVRFAEHAGGKIFGKTASFAIAEDIIKDPKKFRTIEQLLMNAFGGKASLANKISASRKIFCN